MDFNPCLTFLVFLVHHIIKQRESRLILQMLMRNTLSHLNHCNSTGRWCCSITLRADPTTQPLHLGKMFCAPGIMIHTLDMHHNYRSRTEVWC